MRLNQRTCKYAVEILLGQPPSCRTEKALDDARDLVKKIVEARATSKDLSFQEILVMLKDICILSIEAAQNDAKLLPAAQRSLRLIKEMEKENTMSAERFRATVALVKEITPHDLLGIIQTSDDLKAFQKALQDYKPAKKAGLGKKKRKQNARVSTKGLAKGRLPANK